MFFTWNCKCQHQGCHGVKWSVGENKIFFILSVIWKFSQPDHKLKKKKKKSSQSSQWYNMIYGTKTNMESWTSCCFPSSSPHTTSSCYLHSSASCFPSAPLLVKTYGWQWTSLLLKIKTNVGEYGTVACVLFYNKYHLWAGWEGLWTSAQDKSVFLSNIPPSSTGRQSAAFHTISSPFQLESLAALPLLILLLLNIMSYSAHLG